MAPVQAYAPRSNIMTQSPLNLVTVRNVKFGGLYFFIKLRSILPGYCADPWKTIWLDPDQIEWSHKSRPVHGNSESAVGFDPYLDIGRIAGGDWDVEVSTKFNQIPKYRGVVRHFKNGIPWEDTELFEQLETQIKKHGSFDGCRTKSELQDRYQRIDRLYERLDEEYLPRKELCDRFDFSCLIDAPKIHIGRDGRIIHAGGSGYHRIAIASLLDVNIEAHVVVRHKEWIQKRSRIQEVVTPSDVPEQLRKYIGHPDVDTQWGK